MTKQSKEKLSKREELAAKIKWELLSRRKDYLQEAKVIGMSFGKINNKEELLEFIELSDEFFKKWGISGYVPVEKDFKDLTIIEKWGLFKNALNMDHRLVAFLEAHNHPPLYYKDNLKNLSPLKVEINLDMPKDKIMFELSNLIETSQQIKKKIEPKEDHRTKDYEHLLIVYDLRENKKTKKGDPIPFSQIAKKLFPNRECTKTLEDMVRDQYYRAKDLVDNAHKDVW